MHSVIALSLIVFLSLGTVGCTKDRFTTRDSKTAMDSSFARREPFADILASSYAAADNFAYALQHKYVATESPILATSFVNIDNLNESCTLGRIIPEQIASRLAQHNYTILEMKLRHESIFIKEGAGEFILSRELKNISSSVDGSAVLVGTYAVADSYVFISTRIVSTKDNIVLAGQDYRLILDHVTESLLN